MQMQSPIDIVKLRDAHEKGMRVMVITTGGVYLFHSQKEFKQSGMYSTKHVIFSIRARLGFANY